MSNKTATKRRYFGSVRRLPSGRYQARYVGPDDERYAAQRTFDTATDADAWLTLVHADIIRGQWVPPTAEPDDTDQTLSEFAETWLSTASHAPRTEHHYRDILTRYINPVFGQTLIGNITPTRVRQWYKKLPADKPTMRAHTYSLLRVILNAAVEDELIAINPCRIRGASSAKRKKKIKPASVPELAVIVEQMPKRWRLMVVFAAWCALRYEEVAELRRGDIDPDAGVIDVSRAVTFIGTVRHVGPPKSEAGVRLVNIPPHLLPAVIDHLAALPDDPEALLFPSEAGVQLNPSSFQRHYYKAREAAGRKDLNFHALRHTGAVLAAATGATIAELMARLGHSTPGMAIKYQHAAQARDRTIADALSRLAAS